MATANNLGTAYIKIAPQMQGIQSSITKGLSGLSSSISKNVTSSLGKSAGAIAGITSQLVSKAFNAVTSSIDSAISRADTLNVFPKIMKNLGFETDESSSALQKLSDRIEGLPTTLDEIVSYTQRLASSTGNLNKGMYNATNLAIAFNDAALAGGKGQYEANRAFEQFTQVISRGRPSMQDWKIMMEVMPGQLKQMAKYMAQNSKSLQEYAKDAKKTVDQLDGMDLYEWISENKNEFAKERLAELQKAMIDLDNKGGAGITAFKDQVSDATHTIGTAMRLIPVRITKALAEIIKAFGAGDIYTTIDNFTQSFKKIGQFIIKYIVPPIKNEVIPVLKNIIGVIKNVIKWIAETEVAREALGKLLKAFIALKIVTAIGGLVKGFALSIAGMLATVVKATAVTKTFTGVLTTTHGLSEAMDAAKVRAAAFAKTNGSLTKTMEAAGTSAVGLTSKIAGLTIGIGALVAAGVGIYMGLSQIASNTEHAKKVSENYRKSVISEETALTNVNRSLKLQKLLLDDINKAKSAENAAELEYLNTKQTVKDAEAEVNRLKKEGKKGTDEYRIAELELAQAKEARTEAEKKYQEAKKETARVEQSEKDNRMTELNEMNKLTLAAEARAGNYAAIAKQLDELSKKTYQYKDANGKLVNGTKADMESTITYLNEQIARQDGAWRTIYENAKKNGTTFTEECKKLGESGAKGLTGNFATGITKYEPLATKATKNLGIDLMQGLLDGLEGKKGLVSRTLAGAVSKAIEDAKKAAQSHSPSRKTMELGRNLAEGLMIGLDSYEKKLETTAKGVMDTTLSALTGTSTLGLTPNYAGASTSGVASTVAPAQVIQNNTFNQVANTLDVKEASKKLGWEVATAI